MNSIFSTLVFGSLLVAILTVALLHSPITRLIRNRMARVFTLLITGFSILLTGLFLAFHYTFSLPENPLVTKDLDNGYYVTLQANGWAGSMPGTHLHFFLKRTFWWDKPIGHIHWHGGPGDISATFKADETTQKLHLRVMHMSKPVLDTSFAENHGFDFTWPK